MLALTRYCRTEHPIRRRLSAGLHTPMNDTPQEAIHELWDRLSDFPADRIDEALSHLMETLAEWFCADDIVWIGAARLARGPTVRRDPLKGWRGLAVRHHRASPRLLELSRRAAQSQDASPDLTTRALAAGAGRLRVHRLHDGFVDTTAFKRSEAYRILYRGAGISDRMFACMPVNADAESYLLFDRHGAAPRFTPDEASRARRIMRGLRWFHRELLLAHGLGLAGDPLTATERRIVRLLLTERSEKEIAAELGQSPKTTHKYITEILRKYGVKGRIGLMALWLGRGA